MGNTSYKLLKEHFDRNFVKFSGQFLEEFTEKCTEISNFREKLRRNAEEILEIFWALLKIVPGALQSLIWHCLCNTFNFISVTYFFTKKFHSLCNLDVFIHSVISCFTSIIYLNFSSFFLFTYRKKRNFWKG